MALSDKFADAANKLGSLGKPKSANMYKSGHFEYKVKDHTFRDIYARGNVDDSGSKWFIYVMPWVAVGLIQFFALIVIPSLITAVNPAVQGNFFKVILALYLLPLGGWFRSILAIGISAAAYSGMSVFAKRYWESQNADSDKSILDSDEYQDDARIQQPEELSENFDIFPDVGAHSKHLAVTAILGHVPLNNNGLNKVKMPLRADGKTDLDEDGEPINKNVLLYDEDDDLVEVTRSMIDENFGEKLWDSSGIPRPRGRNAAYIRHVLRRRYSPNKLNYNPMKKFGKANVDTVAEWINQDWYMPQFEVQRPAGMYIVDTEPNNTMVLAMTRAGKGQTVIEPTIDCWLRSDNKCNIVCNDPKGELYLKFYYVARKRGYRVVSFNLMEPSRTDIYNPLGYAVEAARKGDNQHVEEYVKTIGDVFFPPDKSDDPMWPNAANAAFQRSALGLIDYYMEEDREIREKAQRGKWSVTQLDRALDESWGHVTLYNVYQMMTQLASKKSKEATFIHIDKDDPSDEKDYLTLFFDATAKLPTNALRTSVQNQDNSLRAMAGSDKTIASVYGISLTAIKFFADAKISRLTSGRPSQNFDIVGMSFPRRFEVKLDSKFTLDEGLRTQGYKWSVYADPAFEHQLGKKGKHNEFVYQNNVSPDGWINYVTKAIFPQETVYLKLEIFEQSTGLPIKTWYFKFKKGYQVSLDGRSYVIDHVSQERVVKDGHLVEIQRKQVNGKWTAVPHQSVLHRKRVSLLEGAGSKKGTTGKVENYDALVFEQIQVHYSEEPVMVDFITPPHLKSYARIILILINQMFNMQVDASYLTLPSQKPYYPTKYMLDEVGNLSSDGSGIPDLQTKESIGLAQGQYFTLILQTLSQLRDIYGDKIDSILQGNSGNILYIKSTDDDMLSKLEALSGKMHRIEHDSQTISHDNYKVINTTDGKVSNNRTVKEVPVISKNDMLQIPKGNLIVFGKGNPVWNRNQCAMPYSFMLLGDAGNPLKDFDDPKEYTLRTVPTTANTMDFDILNNQPNFIEMVSKRASQARLTETKMDLYKQHHQINGHALTDDDLTRIDPEALSKEIMRSINEQIAFNESAEQNNPDDQSGLNPETDFKTPSEIAQGLNKTAEDNPEVRQAQAEQDAKANASDKALYAHHQISRHDLLFDVKEDVKNCLGNAYVKLLDEFKSSGDYDVDDQQNLIVGGQVMIKNVSGELHEAKDSFGENDDVDDDDDDLESGGLANLMDTEEVKDANTIDDDGFKVEVTDNWLKYLAALPSWDGILNGDYDDTVAELYKNY